MLGRDVSLAASLFSGLTKAHWSTGASVTQLTKYLVEEPAEVQRFVTFLAQKTLLWQSEISISRIEAYYCVA